MAIPTTYATLQTEIADWTKRSDMTDRIPVFIAMAESQMNAKLRIRQMEEVESVTLASGTAYATLPARFLEPISLVYSDNNDLTQVDRVALDQAAVESVSGRPRYFAYASSRIDFERTAEANYTLYLRYFKKLDLAADTTNTVLTIAPFAYIYGALAAYSKWIEDEAQTTQYMALFMTEIQNLKELDDRSRGSAPLRTELAEVLNMQVFDITTG